MNRWEQFAREDPYFYIDTAFDQFRDEPGAVDRFYETGRATADALLLDVAELLPGRTLAIEIGCGVGRVLLGHAGQFERVRGVDVAPRMLSMLASRASRAGLDNVDAFLPVEAWDRPAGTADYVYSLHVFQHIESADEIAAYVSRIRGALRPGGIAHLHFDTRPAGFLYRARQHVPDRWLGRTQRRGMRRVRRDPGWIRQVSSENGLDIIAERGSMSDNHWFVLRRG